MDEPGFLDNICQISWFKMSENVSLIRLHIYEEPTGFQKDGKHIEQMVEN